MNNKLWWNDPDCLLIPDLATDSAKVELLGPDGKIRPAAGLTAAQFSFHATATLASGSMVLSGDDVTTYSEKQWALLKKLVSKAPVAARFEDDRLETGWSDEQRRRIVVLLNWGTAPSERRAPRGPSAPSGVPVAVSDFWTGERLGVVNGDVVVTVAPGAGRVLVLESVEAASRQ
jgi:alpha-galactosidase